MATNEGTKAKVFNSTGGGTKEKAFTLFDHVPDDVTNLQMGAPDPDQLKKAAGILKEAAAHRMEQSDALWLMQYGPELGDRKYLEAVAKFLTEQYRAPVDVEDLVANSGATHGLYLLATLLFSRDDLVFVNDPTYFIATQVLSADLGLKIKSVPMDDQGMVPEELEKVLEANKDHRPRELTPKKPFWAILYVIPTFHNPCGYCWPADRCEKIVEIARKYNLLVICDDVYNLLYYGSSSPHRLFAFDRKTDPGYKGNVVSNGSFAKIFGPGMRLGWMEVPPTVKSITQNSGVLRSSGGSNHTISGIMESVLSLGLLKKLLDTSRPVLRERFEAVGNALKTKLPSASFVQPMGGYFMWIKLPDGIEGEDVFQEVEKSKLRFLPGNLSSPTGEFRDHIRISLSFYDKETLLNAVDKISEAVNVLQRQKTSQ